MIEEFQGRRGLGSVQLLCCQVSQITLSYLTAFRSNLFGTHFPWRLIPPPFCGDLRLIRFMSTWYASFSQIGKPPVNSSAWLTAKYGALVLTPQVLTSDPPSFPQLPQSSYPLARPLPGSAM